MDKERAVYLGIACLCFSILMFVHLSSSYAAQTISLGIKEFKVIKLEISRVGFIGDFDITKWSGGSIIVDPVWEKTGKNEPICYIKNTIPTMYAEFTVNPNITDPITNVQIRAKVDTTIIGSASNLTISGTTINDSSNTDGDVDGITGGSLIPDSDAVKTLNVTIAWEFSLDGGVNWYSAGSSGPHKMHWVEATPLESPLYDLALEKACEYVNGNSDIAGKLNEGIDRDITYDPGVDVPGNPLNLYPSGPAQCSNHANLIVYLARSISNMSSSVVYIWGGCSSSDICFYIYSGWWGPSFRVLKPSHDNASADPHFTFHAEGNINGTIYDPSYGTTGLILLDETAPAGVDYFDSSGVHPNHSAAVRQTNSSLPSSIHKVVWTCPH